MFQPPVPSVKLDLGKMKTSNTFLTQMQSARPSKDKKRRESKSGFLSDRRGANGNRAQGEGPSLLASEMVATALASAARK